MEKYQNSGWKKPIVCTNPLGKLQRIIYVLWFEKMRFNFPTFLVCSADLDRISSRSFSHHVSFMTMHKISIRLVVKIWELLVSSHGYVLSLEKLSLTLTLKGNANLYHVTKFPLTCRLLFIISTHKFIVSPFLSAYFLFWEIPNLNLTFAVYVKLKLSVVRASDSNFQVHFSSLIYTRQHSHSTRIVV